MRGRGRSPRSAIRTVRRCGRRAGATDRTCRSRSRSRSGATPRAFRPYPAGSSCVLREGLEDGFPLAAHRSAERELVDDPADSQPEIPDDDDVIRVEMADEIEAFEKAPDGCRAECEAARPERLPNHQHADIFVLLLHQIAADGGKEPD